MHNLKTMIVDFILDSADYSLHILCSAASLHAALQNHSLQRGRKESHGKVICQKLQFWLIS